jgi:Ca2+-transporting ATPase
MAFATLTISQLFHAYDVRSSHHSIFQIGFFTNPAMTQAFLVGLALQLAVLLLPPLRVIFSVELMSGAEWVTVLALSILPTVVCEVVKWRTAGV